MTISKTSFSYISKTYGILHKVFWEFPPTLGYDPRQGWQYRLPSKRTCFFFKVVAICNILLRIFTTIFNIAVARYVPGVTHVEILESFVRSGSNLLTIVCIFLVVIKSELLKIMAFLNGMYLFNRKLGK